MALTWTNTTTGQYTYRSKFVEIVNNLNNERTRRGLAQIAVNSYVPAIGEKITASTINNLRNVINAMYSVSWSVVPVAGQTFITPASITQFRNAINTMGSVCLCQCNNCVHCNNVGCSCNYSCTCNCNYKSCSCNCNYGHIGCQCNYASRCICNYACTCNCNYSCTCNCNYCTCNCNQNTCSCNTQN